jgi:uncharacterized protein YecE (DUF72 family)
MIGTAGWSISRKDADAFPAQGSALERYARVFSGVEVNSSFHRPHRPSTWAKWAASVPDDFRFSVKIPKTITHDAKLVDVDPLIDAFAQEVGALGHKLAVLLVQLPPKLGFEGASAERFFDTLHNAIPAEIACEPRNASWFDDDADALLARLHVARVAADPARTDAGAVPGGWLGLAYWRLHGSPTMYRSPYSDAALETYAAQVGAAVTDGVNAWCMFDNTAASAATADALSLMARLERHDGR